MSFDINCLKGKLIVSCQALPDEPLHSDYIMGRMAYAAMEGGASGIRAQSVSQINEIMKTVDLPVIGIIKRNYDDSDIFITATKKEVEDMVKITLATHDLPKLDDTVDAIAIAICHSRQLKFL